MADWTAATRYLHHHSECPVKANAAIVPAGTNGSITVYASDLTHVIIDVSGYFVPATTASSLFVYPQPHARSGHLKQYRPGPLGQPYLQALQSPSFPLLSSSCNLPSTAQAYSLNFTVVPRGSSLGYCSSWPTGQPQPFVSTSAIDFTGTVVANAAIVGAGTNGEHNRFRCTDYTDVIIDINGYFAPQQTGHSSLYSITCCAGRLDTRLKGLACPSTEHRLLHLLNLSQCPLPSQAQTFVFNAICRS